MTLCEVPPPLAPKISHPFHEHELILVTTREFCCNGCKQSGEGPWHYRCGQESCDFDLHADCATAPDVLQHPLFSGKTLTLFKNHADQNGYMACYACGEETTGFRYHNCEPICFLHPCCAFLPMHILQDGHAFELCNDLSRKCGMCGNKLRVEKCGHAYPNFSYRTFYDDGEQVYLHVSCLAETYNKLKPAGECKWHASAPIMEGIFGTFGRKKGGKIFWERTTTAVQATSTAVTAISTAVKLATLDPGAIIDVAHHVGDVLQ